MTRKPRLSKRRLEVLASYGATVKKNKQGGSQFVDSHLPKHSPIKIQRELELEGYDHQAAKRNAKQARQERLNNDALKNKPSLGLSNHDRLERKRIAEQKKSKEVNSIHLDGLLSAGAAKKGTRDAPSAFDDTSAIFYNMKDNFIEEQYHGKTSAFDPRHNDLIEIDPSNGKMTWHGETCAICTMPPSNMGEIVLAQYGSAEFVCTDCGKLIETKNLGLRGWVFTQIQNIKRHKATQIKKYHLPNAEDDEELA